MGQFVSGLALAFVHGWQLTLIVISAMPVLICAGHGLSKQIERQMTQQAGIIFFLVCRGGERWAFF